jgi:hypothetical protein
MCNLYSIPPSKVHAFEFKALVAGRAVKKLNRFPAALISANKLPLIVTLECLG